MADETSGCKGAMTPVIKLKAVFSNGNESVVTFSGATKDGMRELLRFEADGGERYERVVERAPEWDGKWFRCGACGERLDRFGVRTTQMLDGTTVRRIAEPPRRCPECGAKLRKDDAR